MIRDLDAPVKYLDFALELMDDPCFSEPMLSTGEQMEQHLRRAAGSPDKRALGVFRDDGAMSGLFVFLVLPEERYLEMLVGLSREEEAWEELAALLRESYPGWQADFVFNPKNPLVTALLERRGAAFFTEQQKMVFAGPAPAVDTAGIVPLSGAYREQYLAMHTTDVYWTGERVAAAPELFRVFLAVEEGAVVGYLDLTLGHRENEPVDLLVKKEARRRGWGRKLLAAAIDFNRPAGMMLLVDTDNEPALRLYESMGFVRAERQNSRTATWMIDPDD
ncbi:MAG: GNAT family N-acetyltransferase [Oscillospiraceae bacterium]|nr:GNAT family N-acetyltransferase [Oscillospiraceae bacterium]